MSGEIIVKVRGLNKAYKKQIALSNLDMTVKRGDIFALLGPNGSGKSTSIKILLSLVRPDSGNIEIFGDQFDYNPNKILSRIGSLVESPAFYERVSAINNLSILTVYSGIKKTEEELMETIALVGLESRAYSKVSSFSSGMKQRLGIAQALLHGPELLILDEPFSGLDPQGVRDIRNLITKLNKEKGITVMISSHQLDEIESLANRMIIINNGAAVCEGDVNEIVGKSNLTMIIEVDNPKEAFRKLSDSRLPLKNIFLDGDLIKVNCSHDAIPFINQYLHMSGFKIFAISKEKALENYYLTYT